MRIAYPTVIILIIIAYSVEAFADQQGQRRYLPEGAVDAQTLIGPPPERGSAEHKTQMDIVLWLQETRTPQQVAFAEKTLNLERFAPIISTSLVGVDGKALKETLDGVISEVRMDYDALKGVYDEPRPFQIDDRVRPVGDARPVAAYPSGHSIRATVYGTLLSGIFPEHEADLMELANQVGYGRVIAGAHYPVDVTAGQKLGAAYADIVARQPAYIEAVKLITG
ncbi:phosphatase PAP2 family protein [Hoeflea sp. TYP-13]|uniref:phosphatase PAP2 family protein n=1 Tax=Hoeflea sp. TYP-13 TaxID=3230023 RepID=UPI0034C60AF9